MRSDTLDFYVNKNNQNIAKAFISNTDLKSFGINVDNLVRKDVQSIQRLQAMVSALRDAGVLKSFFIDTVVAYPNGISCMMSKRDANCKEDPFFQSIKQQKVIDYRNGPEMQCKAPMVNRKAYSYPIPVGEDLTIVTTDMSSIISCAQILKGLTVSSRLVKRNEEYHLDVQIKKPVVDNRDQYIAMWLRLSEYGAVDFRVLDEQCEINALIQSDAIQKICTAFETADMV